MPTVTTAPPDTSEPVPDVVGTVTSGSAGSVTATSKRVNRSNGSPCPNSSRAALAMSMVEPPPIATSASACCSCSRAVSPAIISKVGSPGGLRYVSPHTPHRRATASIAATGSSTTASALV